VENGTQSITHLKRPSLTLFFSPPSVYHIANNQGCRSQHDQRQPPFQEEEHYRFHAPKKQAINYLCKLNQLTPKMQSSRTGPSSKSWATSA
jgi:hypothetical protein